MKKTLQKVGILVLIFIIAVVVYFISARNVMEKETTVYTSMDEPTLPVIYTELSGIQINGLHGYMRDMGNQAARDSIYVLLNMAQPLRGLAMKSEICLWIV